jgi:hypothetical protein
MMHTACFECARVATGRRKTDSISKTSVETTELPADVGDLSGVTLRLMKAPKRDTLRDFWNRWARWGPEIRLPRDRGFVKPQASDLSEGWRGLS